MSVGSWELLPLDIFLHSAEDLSTGSLDQVSIKSVELTIIDKAYDMGWMKPCPPKTRTEKRRKLRYLKYDRKTMWSMLEQIADGLVVLAY